MSAALFIVASDAASGFDMEMDGKALMQASEELTDLAAELGVSSLMDFFSADPADLAEVAGEEALDTPPEQWFEPEVGLVTVHALLARLLEDSTVERDYAQAVQDLRQCERILNELANRGLKWHFAMDI